MTTQHRTRLDILPATPLPGISHTRWIRGRLQSWWVEHARDFAWRHTRDEYRVAIAEVLLQQTTATAAATLYLTFLKRFPSWQILAAATSDDVQELVTPLGLGARRAARLHHLARWVTTHGHELPVKREDLEGVPGIGPYVASAILATRGEPEPLLDVNMVRVIERLFGVRERADLRADPWLQHVSRRLFPGLEMGWTVLDFASAICRARAPRCNACPLASRCMYASSALEEARRT